MPGTFGAISPAFATGKPGSVSSRFLRIQVPRFTGDVRVPLEVIVRIEACVTIPPRCTSGGTSTLRNVSPRTPGMP